ncbi:MAG: class I SAM-dependent methyltransferase [Caldilineaceae bacterium]|nr:class I SAM-dependent methyltransferase [Caldilineaceae bacterium]MCB0122147.1 class I SAM-dependent methyltransferase [Caldilineaceae bacterium]MCB0183286.1 class I SAM-dependent methyltransferase [Caldilineaceae bacterium]
MSIKRLLLRIFNTILDKLPPEQTLRLLFRLDRWLYYVQGKLAAAYGEGVHTKHRHMNYHRFFVQRIAPGERVLDVGSNHGAVSFDIAEQAGATVVGMEINPALVAEARQRHPHPKVEYRVGDVLTDQIDEHFDVIVLSNVLEHLPQRPQLLRRLQEATHPARFLIRVPLFERDWRVPLKQELGVEWRLDPTHEIEYTLESFAEEMAAAQLQLLHQEIRWGEIWAELAPQANAQPGQP